jgi:hypothetical protein
LLLENKRWTGMRLTGQVLNFASLNVITDLLLFFVKPQVRHEKSLPVPQLVDSKYTVCLAMGFVKSCRSFLCVQLRFDLQPIERTTRHFNPLAIPRKLQEALPYKSKPKVGTPLK